MATAYADKANRGTGRHKEAVARIRLKPGSGRIFINGKLMNEYFSNRKALEVIVLQPLMAADVSDQFDVLIKVHGGGIAGQAHAIRLGIARALAEKHDDHFKIMRKEGFLTRDTRVKERKKYGRKRARKRFQFSKR